MATATLSRVDERVQVRGWVSSAATEFILCGVAFLVLRALIIALVDAGPFYRDEVTFTEGGLRMAANRLDSGDYIHGPVIYYLMLGVDLFTAIIKLVVGQISSTTGFLYWYIENPDTLRVLGRVVMSVGGAATIAATMYAAHKVSLSRTQARIAGLILLGMPMFHHLSWYIKEDLWAALFGILAAASAYQGKFPVKAGLLFGFAIASKYTAVALAPALLLLIVTSEWTGRADWRFRVKGCLRFVLATTITSFILNPYALIHLVSFLSQLQEINAVYIAGLSVNGSKPPLLAGLVFGEFIPFGIGITALSCVAGAIALNRGKVGREQMPFLLAVITVITLLALSRAGFARTLALALPFLAVFASTVCHYLNRSPRFSAALGIALVVMSSAQTAGFYRYVTAPDTRELARSFVEKSLSSDTVILMEGIHDHVADAGLTLRPNLSSLKAERIDITSKGGSGRLNQLRLERAIANPNARFEILPAKDFAMSGADQLDQAHVVITCKWPSNFPEARAYNVPESSSNDAVRDYLQRRQVFYELMEKDGFHLMAEFNPTLRAQWSFIDRADPRVFGMHAWLNGAPIVGPEIAVYSR